MNKNILKPHIVVIGAGFGGIYAAKKLVPYVKRGEIDVTIINPTNYFLFTPLLHEVATGSLTPNSVAEPIREIFYGTGIEFCQGKVVEIDSDNRRAHIFGKDGNGHTIPYDYAILSTGAEPNYYGISGAEQNSFPLKDLKDAAAIRNRIIDSFEEAILTNDPIERQRFLTFVVVGGGPTGVETVAEILEFAKEIASKYHNVDILGPVSVILVHSGEDILPRMNTSIRELSLARLKSKGIDVRLKSKVRSVSSRGVVFEDGSRLDAGIVVWAAGVAATFPHIKGVYDDNASGGRLPVDEYFRVVGDEKIFALGDAVSYDQAGQILPMFAQVAVRQADLVARNVMATIREKKLSKLVYTSRGTLVSLGNWCAAGELSSFSAMGWYMWWLWRTVYLFKFASWKKRLRIAGEWSILLFTRRDITKYDR